MLNRYGLFEMDDLVQSQRRTASIEGPDAKQRYLRSRLRRGDLETAQKAKEETSDKPTSKEHQAALHDYSELVRAKHPEIAERVNTAFHNHVDLNHESLFRRGSRLTSKEQKASEAALQNAQAEASATGHHAVHFVAPPTRREDNDSRRRYHHTGVLNTTVQMLSGAPGTQAEPSGSWSLGVGGGVIASKRAKRLANIAGGTAKRLFPNAKVGVKHHPTQVYQGPRSSSLRAGPTGGEGSTVKIHNHKELEARRA